MGCYGRDDGVRYIAELWSDSLHYRGIIGITERLLAYGGTACVTGGLLILHGDYWLYRKKIVLKRLLACEGTICYRGAACVTEKMIVLWKRLSVSQRGCWSYSDC